MLLIRHDGFPDNAQHTSQSALAYTTCILSDYLEHNVRNRYDLLFSLSLSLPNIYLYGAGSPIATEAESFQRRPCDCTTHFAKH